MNRIKKLSIFLFVFLLIMQSYAYAANYHYATTDMTFAEFYAGEVGENAADLTETYDAVSTATTNFIKRMVQYVAESNDEGTTYSGVKAVQVRMTDDVYNALTDKSRYTFVDEEFSEYKDVNASGNFGKMVTESIDVTASCDVSMSSYNSYHSQYMLEIEGLDFSALGLKTGENRTPEISRSSTLDYYLGGTLTTSDGKVYGLKPLSNLWVQTSEMGFAVSEYQSHNKIQSYKHTADLEGKTITEIRYILKNQPDVVVKCNVFVKSQTSAAVSADKTTVDAGQSITFTFTDAASDANYQLASITSTARGASSISSKFYTYSNGTLTLKENFPNGTFKVTFSSEKYVDISSANITVNGDYYATKDMTWAEFYAGELGKNTTEIAANYDVVSTATTRFVTRFSGFNAKSDDNGTTFEGVKAVQVYIPRAVYNTLTNSADYTLSNTPFTEYKELLDTNGNFGKMLTETKTADGVTVAITGGTNNRHGNYRLTITGLDYDKFGVNIGDNLSNFLGATLTTKENNVYGLKPLHNLWIRGNLAEQIGFSVQEFTERNNTKLSYAHTKDLPGQTINKITYMFKNQPDIVINCDLFVKNWSSAKITDVTVEAGKTANVTFTDAASDANYTLSAIDNFTYSNGVLTVKEGTPAGDYTLTFVSEKYSDITLAVTVTGDHYATTNMTWAEFYAGETKQTPEALLAAGLDAISTPTTAPAVNRFPLLMIASSDSGTVVSGEKAVQVRMSEELFQIHSKDSRYTFATSKFDEYKELNTNGTFGAMVTETKTSNAVMTLASGASARWGHYVLSTAEDIDLGFVSGDKVARNYLGVLIETSDGKIYGMRHDNNLWSNTDIAFTVNENYTEPHGRGVQRDYKYTAELEGKTISKITYMLKDLPDIVITTNITLPKLSTASATTTNTQIVAGNNVSIPVNFSDNAIYKLVSLKMGSGRNAVDVDAVFENNELKVENLAPGNYTAVFSTDGYSDISMTFEVIGYHYALTDMTWAEFYAGEVGTTAKDLLDAGLDAVSSPTARIAGRFSQLTSQENNIGGADITGVKAVQVRMSEELFLIHSNDERYEFVDEIFDEYKELDENGNFGEMFTLYDEQKGVVTLSSGQNSTWGNYTLDISGINVTLGSGDTSYYLGALITTDDGKVYGMRHNSNLWFQAGTIALTFEEFVEVHGVSRPYEYTSDLMGKTVKKIQYMLKNLPDVVVECNVLLKNKTDAKVSVTYEEGYNGVYSDTGGDVTMNFTGVPNGANYTLSSVATSGRGSRALDSSMYSYANNVLTFNPEINAATYKVVFTDEKYMDITANVVVFTAAATDLLISADKNEGEINFLLTPRGYIDAVDAELDENKFVNATEYTNKDVNTSANYTSGTGNVQGSGFTFDIAVNNVSSDYKAIVGFGKMFFMTRSNLGDMYNDVFTAVNAKPAGESGYKEFPDFTDLNSLGLRAVQVLPNGTLRDVSEFTGAGAMILGEDIMLFYGSMAADCNLGEITEGEHMLSPEGELMICDGLRDGHVSVTMYIQALSNSGDDNNNDNDNNNNNNDNDEREPSEISDPVVNVNSESVQTTIKNALGNSITSTTQILALPASSSGTSRTLTQQEASALPANETPVLALPIINISQDAVYVFSVELTSLDVGTPIKLHLNPESKVNAPMYTADDDEDSYTFLNDAGQKIDSVPANKSVNIAAYLESDKTYAPVITTTAQNVSGVVGSSGGGCDLGMSAPMMLAAVMLLIKRKK